MAEYLSGSLPERLKSGVEKHALTCPQCAEALEEYRAVIVLITGEPCLIPTVEESRALAQELSLVRQNETISQQARERSAVEMMGLSLASVAAFVIVAVVVALEVFGRISIVPETSPLGLAKMALTALIIMIVASFIPIFVTAQRRPLNGLTFRR
jgi:anti-sigma factor RsiW